MENNIDFKDLWKQQVVSPPNIEDLFSKLKHFKRISMRKLILTNVVLIATCILYIFLWYNYQPEFISTKIGIILIILAMVIYLFVYNRLATFYKTSDGTQSNSEYLQNLILIKTKQQFLKSTILNLYFVILVLGLCLYMYEYTSRVTIFRAILSYVLILGFMGFAWFYIEPRIVKKEKDKINDLIAKFEAVNKQLEESL